MLGARCALCTPGGGCPAGVGEGGWPAGECDPDGVGGWAVGPHPLLGDLSGPTAPERGADGRLYPRRVVPYEYLAASGDNLQDFVGRLG